MMIRGVAALAVTLVLATTGCSGASDAARDETSSASASDTDDGGAAGDKPPEATVLDGPIYDLASVEEFCTTKLAAALEKVFGAPQALYPFNDSGVFAGGVPEIIYCNFVKKDTQLQTYNFTVQQYPYSDLNGERTYALDEEEFGVDHVRSENEPRGAGRGKCAISSKTQLIYCLEYNDYTESDDKLGVALVLALT